MSRLFVSVWPPEDVIRILGAMERPAAPGVRWAGTERLHVTLRFLGECSEAEAAAALRSARLPVTRVTLGPSVERLGRGVLVVPAQRRQPRQKAHATAAAGTPHHEQSAHALSNHCKRMAMCVLTRTNTWLYRADIGRVRHPKKDVEKVLAELEDAGWTITTTSGGHRWGVARCGDATRSGCQVSIWSTPANAGGHARQIRRFLRRCPHQWDKENM